MNEQALLKGFRTFIIGAGIAVAPAGLQYVANFDWTQYLGPNAALFISGVVMVLMRMITNTSPGTKV